MESTEGSDAFSPVAYKNSIWDDKCGHFVWEEHMFMDQTTC